MNLLHKLEIHNSKSTFESCFYTITPVKIKKKIILKSLIKTHQIITNNWLLFREFLKLKTVMVTLNCKLNKNLFNQNNVK